MEERANLGSSPTANIVLGVAKMPRLAGRASARYRHAVSKKSPRGVARAQRLTFMCCGTRHLLS